MKSTKRAFTVALIAGLTMPAFNSCKKGEGDPFLSLSSRKARVAGDWTISKSITDAKSVNTSSYPGSSPSISNYTFYWEIDGGSVKMSDHSKSSGDYGSEYKSVGNGKAESTISFKKDGTYTIVQKLTNVARTITQISGGGEFAYNVTENSTTESSGTWNFLGGVESDYKNKERIVLNTLKEMYSTTTIYAEDGSKEISTNNYTYANGQYMQIWHLTTLKKKEMVIEGDLSGTGTYVGSHEFDGEKETMSGTSAYTGKMSMVLRQ